MGPHNIAWAWQEKHTHTHTHRGGFRGGALGAEAPPPKFYYEQGRKLLEAACGQCSSTVLIQI